MTSVARKEMKFEEKATSSERALERQEHELVRIINHYTSTGTPIVLKFDNDVELENVLSASKVGGLAEYGKEPYTDVQIETPVKVYNFSLKGLDAPSLAGAGAQGIEHMLPGWLQSITPKVVARLQEMGFEDGDWFIDKPRDMKAVMRKITKAFSKKYPGTPVVISGYPDGKEYSLYDKPHPPYMGNAKVSVKDDVINIVNHIVDNEASKHLPDMYFKIGEENIRTLLAGTVAMGGPIDYTYRGPMDVPHIWDEETRTLSFSGATAYDIDNFVESYPDIYLRIRKRRADQPFSPSLDHHRLGKAIFGKGLFSRESYARIVITDKLSSKGEYGGEL